MLGSMWCQGEKEVSCMQSMHSSPLSQSPSSEFFCLTPGTRSRCERYSWPPGLRISVVSKIDWTAANLLGHYTFSICPWRIHHLLQGSMPTTLGNFGSTAHEEGFPIYKDHSSTPWVSLGQLESRSSLKFNFGQSRYRRLRISWASVTSATRSSPWSQKPVSFRSLCYYPHILHKGPILLVIHIWLPCESKDWLIEPTQTPSQNKIFLPS